MGNEGNITKTNGVIETTSVVEEEVDIDNFFDESYFDLP
jgi:hypothetical protein